jgi:hypothetical protein
MSAQGNLGARYFCAHGLEPHRGQNFKLDHCPKIGSTNFLRTTSEPRIFLRSSAFLAAASTKAVLQVSERNRS